MMGEDLAIEAREAAVREVAKLLPLPELLQSISAIKADYITRQQVPFHHNLFFPIRTVLLND
ncbi:similar to SEC6 [Actinidia rufa]|uniref:Similar to SEC6 n=1 Tax=Actinidia rufa TaxID=165716 RepID=A0A7J0GV78_9ERIC|nr:similar to SEC6 [Actinidia rufa]